MTALSLHWCLKVIIGLGLIGHFITLTLNPDLLPALFQLPYPGFLVLVLGGGGMVLWHHRILRRAWRRAGERFILVRRGGLFGRVRHPMYLGDAILYAGLASYPATPISLAGLAVGWWALSRQASREDRELATTFGDDHRRWRQATGLLLPRVSSPRSR